MIQACILKCMPKDIPRPHHKKKKKKQLRYMTDGVLLRETLFEPDLDRYCAWKPCQENGTHFAIHSFKDTDVALQEY